MPICDHIDGTMDTLLSVKYFSKFDLYSGYWQIEMKDEDKEKAAVTVDNLGFYECNWMTFGLTNAPATFQHLMEHCMGELNLKEGFICLDGIAILYCIPHLSCMQASKYLKIGTCPASQKLLHIRGKM